MDLFAPRRTPTASIARSVKWVIIDLEEFFKLILILVANANVIHSALKTWEDVWQTRKKLPYHPK